MALLTAVFLSMASPWVAVCSAFGDHSPEHAVDAAEVIAVVEAPAEYVEVARDNAWFRGILEFRTIRVLKGRNPGMVSIGGTLEDRDDYNMGAVPYRSVRPGGEGPCIARNFRPGARYLFLMRMQDEHLTPYWKALAPTNEQLQPAFRNDPWFRWVKKRVRPAENEAAQHEPAADGSLLSRRLHAQPPRQPDLAGRARS